MQSKMTVSKMYQGTGILKSDCKQPLRIGIIRALNEGTGRLFRATTRHNHNSSNMQSKMFALCIKMCSFQNTFRPRPFIFLCSFPLKAFQ